MVRSDQLPVIKRGVDGPGTALQDVVKDNGSLNIFVYQEFLYRANIISALEQMRGIGLKGDMSVDTVCYKIYKVSYQ